MLVGVSRSIVSELVLEPIYIYSQQLLVSVYMLDRVSRSIDNDTYTFIVQ